MSPSKREGFGTLVNAALVNFSQLAAAGLSGNQTLADRYTSADLDRMLHAAVEQARRQYHSIGADISDDELIAAVQAERRHPPC